MIGSFASSVTASLVAYQNFSNIAISIAISCYLEAQIDYRPFLLFYRVMSHNYAQKISSQFDKN